VIDPAAPAEVAAALEGLAVRTVSVRDGMAALELERECLHEALARLKGRAGFDQVSFVTAVDHYPAEPRFEVVHQLLCHARRERVRLKTRVAEGDAWVPSCIDLWPGAAYMERECYDLFGIRFEGHAGLKRLLMPEEYSHHPLRKDFPHQGIEPGRLYREWDRRRRAGWTSGSLERVHRTDWRESP